LADGTLNGNLPQEVFKYDWLAYGGPALEDLERAVHERPSNGWSAVHWSTVGDPRADDLVIMAWALANGYVVFTHDLDFGTMLALTHATGPSVLQARGQTVLPEDIGPVVIAALGQQDAALAAGALVVVDVKTSRVRVLPL
jgi:predicted nuclease of predicted toxin-antitoxin system